MKILKIPVYWTPEEASTIYALLQDLTEEVWQQYSQDIQQFYAGIQAEQQKQQDASDEHSDF